MAVGLEPACGQMIESVPPFLIDAELPYLTMVRKINDSRVWAYVTVARITSDNGRLTIMLALPERVVVAVVTFAVRKLILLWYKRVGLVDMVFQPTGFLGQREKNDSPSHSL